MMIDVAERRLAWAKFLEGQLNRLLDAVLWDAFSEEDETLEIDRAVAEEIRKQVEGEMNEEEMNKDNLVVKIETDEYIYWEYKEA